MKNFRKRITAMGAALVMSASMFSIGASANTVSDSYNSLYYTGSETTTNYYVTYSKGTNKTSSSRYMVINSILYTKSSSGSTSVLSSNSSTGVTSSSSSRSCYARGGASNVYMSYHRSYLCNTTSGDSGSKSVITRYIYY
ncbi:MAG: hypothetical protein LUI06_00175 [Ruminococcus sp.]|nr:hypothetical protein [Ruminococcus sp.]